MSILYRYTRDVKTSEDLLQDTFIKIFQNLDTYDNSKGNFENWTTRIAINNALQYKRKKKELLIEDLPEAYFNEEISIFNKLSVSELKEAIAKLPEVYRVILNLYYFENYSHKEISELIGIKKSSSRSQLSRAKSLLIERWNKLNLSGL